MRVLNAIASGIDWLNEMLGRILIGLVPFIVLISVAVVVLRYAFKLGFPWLSESFIWLNGVLFTLGAAYLLMNDHHVRVDLLYSKLSNRGRAYVNLGGVVLLLWPTMYAVLTTAWPSVRRSVLALEHSPTMDGLPFLYVLKICVPLFCILVALQGLSLAIRSIAVLKGHASAGKSVFYQGNGHG